VIDPATNTVVDTLPLDFTPRDVAVSTDGARLYVTGSDGVSVLDPSDGGVLALFPGPRGVIAVDPSGARLYVTDGLDGTLTLLDATTGVVDAVLPIGVAPQDVAVDARGRRLWVTSAGESPNAAPDEVTVVAPRQNAVVRRADGGATPTGVALATRSRLVVANFYTGDVLILKAASGRLLRTAHAGAGAAAVAVVQR
jgi:YVTN family beta-propeller protein